MRLLWFLWSASEPTKNFLAKGCCKPINPCHEIIKKAPSTKPLASFKFCAMNDLHGGVGACWNDLESRIFGALGAIIVHTLLVPLHGLAFLCHNLIIKYIDEMLGDQWRPCGNSWGEHCSWIWKKNDELPTNTMALSIGNRRHVFVGQLPTGSHHWNDAISRSCS